MIGTGAFGGVHPRLRIALAAWVLLLALVPYLHKPFVHPAAPTELAWVICTGDGAHEVPPPVSKDKSCPVLGLLQVFGTELVPLNSALPVPLRVERTGFGSLVAWRIPDAALAYTPVQPRAPPFV
jgi:hypothetical protein